MSAGVKTAISIWAVPALSTVPIGGAYSNVPGTFAVGLNWLVPSGVPYRMGIGLVQAMVGVAFNTSIETVALAVVYLLVSVGVNATESGCAAPGRNSVPAGGE